EMNRPVQRQMGNIAAFEQHLTAGGFDVAAEQVKKCCLTRTVRPDDRMQRPGLNLDTDRIYSHQRTKFAAQAAGFQNDVVLGHRVFFAIFGFCDLGAGLRPAPTDSIKLFDYIPLRLPTGRSPQRSTISSGSRQGTSGRLVSTYS